MMMSFITFSHWLAIIGCLSGCIAALVLRHFDKRGDPNDPARRRWKAETTFWAAILAALVSLAAFEAQQSKEKHAAEEARIAAKKAEDSDAENRKLQQQILTNVGHAAQEAKSTDAENRKSQREILLKQQEAIQQAEIRDAQNRSLQIQNRKLQEDILVGEASARESISNLQALLTEKDPSTNCPDFLSSLLPVLNLIASGLTNSPNPEITQSATDLLGIIGQAQTNLNARTTNAAILPPGGLHIVTP